jgi:hypothetical protein
MMQDTNDGCFVLSFFNHPSQAHVGQVPVIGVGKEGQHDHQKEIRTEIREEHAFPDLQRLQAFAQSLGYGLFDHEGETKPQAQRDYQRAIHPEGRLWWHAPRVPKRPEDSQDNGAQSQSCKGPWGFDGDEEPSHREGKEQQSRFRQCEGKTKQHSGHC